MESSCLRENLKVLIKLSILTLKETNFYLQDEMREHYDKTYTGRKNTELLRDQMMEDYMVKKRMKRKVRNDFEEYDDFES